MSSSKVNSCCSPDDISLYMYLFCDISEAPTMTTNGISLLLQYTICFFNFAGSGYSSVAIDFDLKSAIAFKQYKLSSLPKLIKRTLYHSRHAFSLHKNSQLVRSGEKCLFYCLGNPRDEFDGARKIPFNTRIDTGAWDINNEVSYMTLQSDSGADMGASVYTEMLGTDMFGFGSRIADSHINMNLLS